MKPENWGCRLKDMCQSRLRRTKLQELDRRASSTSRVSADTLIGIFKRNHTWICPTLIMRNNYAVLDDRSLANDPRLRYVKPSWKKSWLSMTNGSGNVPATEWAGRRETVQREKVLIGRFQKAG